MCAFYWLQTCVPGHGWCAPMTVRSIQKPRPFVTRATQAILPAQVANLSFENYEKLWKMFVDAFAACLLECGGRWEPETPAAGRLKELCIEAGALRVAVALAHPSRMTHYHFMMGQARDVQGVTVVKTGMAASGRVCHVAREYISPQLVPGVMTLFGARHGMCQPISCRNWFVAAANGADDSCYPFFR